MGIGVESRVSPVINPYFIMRRGGLRGLGGPRGGAGFLGAVGYGQSAGETDQVVAA